MKPNRLWIDLLSSRTARQPAEETWELCQQAVAEHPNSAEVLVSAAVAMMKLDRADEAERFLAKAAVLRPQSPVIWNNLGLALRNQNRISEALRCCEKAIELDGDFARAHYDRAFSLLLKGDYRRGLPEYEHRWTANGLERPGDSDPKERGRLWDGGDPRGRRILIYAEQGLGDTIQFARYIAPLKARGANVVLETQPALRDLMRWLRPECEVGDGRKLPLFDLHCPLMTLPMLFESSPENLPAPAVFEVPVLMREKWEKKVGYEGRVRVGLVWAGNAENPMDDRRSTSLRVFESLLSDADLREGVRFFSFQVGSRASELGEFARSGWIADLSAELTPATESAAALLQMDVVITVDTFVAHLAASMGIRVWLLLAFAPDWRWLLQREDSPWYPTVRLFRQSSAGDWAGVVERVGVALRSYVGQSTVERKRQ